jgi:hypothetical protein
MSMTHDGMVALEPPARGIPDSDAIVTRNVHLADSFALEGYRVTGGCTALAKPLQVELEVLTEEVGDRYAGLLTPDNGDRILEGLA